MKEKFDFDLTLIVPFINDANIHNLLNSLKYNKTLKIQIILIDICNVLDEDFNLKIPNCKIIILKTTKSLNSSESRNFGLKYIFNLNELKLRYIMFPDDDSSFDESFFKVFENIENKNYIINLLCKENYKAFAKYKIPNDKALLKSDYAFIGCVRILYKYELIYKIGLFDENMGVNSKYGAGEDGDYFIRSLNYSKIFYNDNLYTLHPSPDNKYNSLSFSNLILRFTNYSKGVVYLHYKHRMPNSTLKLIIRGIGGFFVNLLRLRIKLSIVFLVSFFVRIQYFIKLFLLKLT